MPLAFSNDFCTACEPIAWVGHKRNDPIGCPIAIIVVDVDLQEIQRHQLASFSKHSTHSLRFKCVVASYKVVSTRKKVRSAHVEIPKVEWLGMREGRKGERLVARSMLVYAQARA
jgi:hypothetical protein